MQDQQRDRYLSRRVLSSTSQSKFDNDIQPGIAPKKLPSEDDLGLFTHSETLTKPPSAEQSIANAKHPLEVTFLQNEIERLQLHTTELNVAVAQKTREVAEVRSKMEEEKEALGGVSSKATQRIVELSRRNRELMSELAAEKNRVRQLQKELQEVVSKLPIRIDEQAKETPATLKVAEPDDKLTIARLQDELFEAKQKSTEYRNQCQQLKQELKLAHKAILKEVGEGTSLQAIFSSTSGWRGRAQQIVALQNKVTELKQQLQSHASLTGNVGQAVEAREEKGKPEERQKATIRKMEEERKKRLDETRSELQNLQELHIKCQQQNTALKARNRTLTSDAKALKAQVTSLLEKTASDSALIQALMTETGQGHNGITLPQGTVDRSDKLLRMQLDTCLAELKTLRKQASQFKEESYDAEQQSSRCSTRLREGPSTPPHDGSVSLPPIKLSHGMRGIARLRKSVSAGHHLPWSGDVDITELQALLRVTEVEKERLLELTTVLQTRLDTSCDRCMKLEVELRTCRQHAAELEKHVSRQPPLCKQSSGKSGKTACVANSGGEVNIEDLKSQLSVQLDENCVLKENLALTRHEKMEDMKMLHSMLQETKQMFIESIKVIRENTRNKHEN